MSSRSSNAQAGLLPNDPPLAATPTPGWEERWYAPPVGPRPNSYASSEGAMRVLHALALEFSHASLQPVWRSSNGISTINNRRRKRTSKEQKRVACVLLGVGSKPESRCSGMRWNMKQVQTETCSLCKRTIIRGMGLFQIQAQKRRVARTEILEGSKRRSEFHTQAQQAISTCMIPKLTKKTIVFQA